jgi:hypothetical protein
MRRMLEIRVARLEKRLAHELRPKKRTLPDWLQVVYEEQGFVFDAAGQVVSAPPHAGISETQSSETQSLVP